MQALKSVQMGFEKEFTSAMIREVESKHYSFAFLMCA
jgi:hypothetical protein